MAVDGAGPPPQRQVRVPPARLERWVENFAARHGGVVRDEPASAEAGDQAGEQARLLVAADGEHARLTPGLTEARVALLLVRRGGYAVGLALGDELVATKAGTRYVQSRTAAGGWSQQRYARRRSNQADALVKDVAGHLRRVLGDGDAGPPAAERRAAGPAYAPDAVVVGGDAALVSAVLTACAGDEEPVLRRVPTLPRHEVVLVGHPRSAVLADALTEARSWHITVTGD